MSRRRQGHKSTAKARRSIKRAADVEESPFSVNAVPEEPETLKKGVLPPVRWRVSLSDTEEKPVSFIKTEGFGRYALKAKGQTREGVLPIGPWS